MGFYNKMMIDNEDVQCVEVVAEVGNIHEGSVGLAGKMVEEIARSGADTVKFQTHFFEDESLDSAPNPVYFDSESRRSYFERTALSKSAYEYLIQLSATLGIQFLSSPFSIRAVDFLLELGVKRLKIASGEVTNLQMLRYVSETGLPVLLSTGMSTLSEIDAAVEALRSQKSINITIMQCTSMYPPADEDLGLNVIGLYKKRFDCSVGFSDHSRGFAAGVIAAWEGACIIEKHFTLSNKMYGSDAFNALEPDQMTQYVNQVKSASRIRMNPVDKDEMANKLSAMRTAFQKAIVTSKFVAAGETLTLDHVTSKKPCMGISADEIDMVVGRRVRCDLPKNSLISWDLLSD